MKYYAIASKSWVELREAEEEPKEVKSVTTEVKDRVKRTIRLTLYQGGKVIGMVPARQFSATTGIRLPPGQIHRLNKEFLKPLLKFDWKYQDIEVDQPGSDDLINMA